MFLQTSWRVLKYNDVYTNYYCNSVVKFRMRWLENYK